MASREGLECASRGASSRRSNPPNRNVGASVETRKFNQLAPWQARRCRRFGSRSVSNSSPLQVAGRGDRLAPVGGEPLPPLAISGDAEPREHAVGLAQILAGSRPVAAGPPQRGQVQTRPTLLIARLDRREDRERRLEPLEGL